MNENRRRAPAHDKKVRSGSLRSLQCTLALAVLMSGCFAPPDTVNSDSLTGTPSASPTIAPASGPRAAKIIFKIPSGGSENGSFNAPDTRGTLVGAGLGHEAVRVFNPDGTLLSSSGPGSTNWPRWLTKVEIGVSGSANTAAKNANCARFTDASDPGGKCYGAGTNSDCSGPAGYYRVSEYDCLSGDITDGKGDADDGVYVRAYFSRETANLDPSENIMAVVEYSASALSAPQDPSACFTGGAFTPEACSDVNWKIFLRTSASASAVPPFVMFIPPTVGLVDATIPRGGTGVTTKQVFLPLASDTSLQVFQLSRIKSRLPKNDAKLVATCSASDIGNSPLCVGMVLYSITFYRI